MAVTVGRVHLAMAHAALPRLLPTPPTCTMLPLLPAPPCAVLLPNNISPPRPSRADAAGRWDAHKTKPAGSPALSLSSSFGGQNSLDVNRKIVTSSRTSSDKNSNSSRADSGERWDAHKRPASPASSSSSSSTASSNKAKTCHVSRRPNGCARSSASSSERWDAHKKPRGPVDGLDDGESSTGSNDVELDMPRPLPPPPPPRSFYAGPGFIKSPEPCMLPMPSFCRIRVA